MLLQRHKLINETLSDELKHYQGLSLDVVSSAPSEWKNKTQLNNPVPTTENIFIF